MYLCKECVPCPWPAYGHTTRDEMRRLNKVVCPAVWVNVARGKLYRVWGQGAGNGPLLMISDGADSDQTRLEMRLGVQTLLTSFPVAVGHLGLYRFARLAAYCTRCAAMRRTSPPSPPLNGGWHFDSLAGCPPLPPSSPFPLPPQNQAQNPHARTPTAVPYRPFSWACLHRGAEIWRSVTPPCLALPCERNPSALLDFTVYTARMHGC